MNKLNADLSELRTQIHIVNNLEDPECADSMEAAKRGQEILSLVDFLDDQATRFGKLPDDWERKRREKARELVKEIKQMTDQADYFARNSKHAEPDEAARMAKRGVELVMEAQGIRRALYVLFPEVLEE